MSFSPRMTRDRTIAMSAIAVLMAAGAAHIPGERSSRHSAQKLGQVPKTGRKYRQRDRFRPGFSGLGFNTYGISAWRLISTNEKVRLAARAELDALRASKGSQAALNRETRGHTKARMRRAAA